METKQSTRIESLDIFRALTMFLMLFVNDIPGLKEIPYWLLHATRDQDMLGFSDTIFPGFLFAMGMAIPFAIQNRMKKGDTMTEVFSHIFWRSVALIVMGVFTVNRDTLDATATGMSGPWFTLLMVLGFFLLWAVYPDYRDWRRYVILGMKRIGLFLLLFIACIYKGQGGMSFSPQWWGILGLIGWTYLACSLIYLVVRDKLFLNTVAFLLLAGCSVASAMGLFEPYESLIRYIPSEATLYAFGMAGIWASICLQKFADRQYPNLFFVIMTIIGLGMLAAGIIAHQHWIISKLQATPTWLFFCCSIFFPLFAFIYWLTDVKGETFWFFMIRPAGTVTLTCYIIPYVWYSLESLLQVHYPAWALIGGLGLIKSLVYSLLVIGVAWCLMKIGIRLKI